MICSIISRTFVLIFRRLCWMSPSILPSIAWLQSLKVSQWFLRYFKQIKIRKAGLMPNMIIKSIRRFTERARGRHKNPKLVHANWRPPRAKFFWTGSSYIFPGWGLNINLVLWAEVPVYYDETASFSQGKSKRILWWSCFNGQRRHVPRCVATGLLMLLESNFVQKYHCVSPSFSFFSWHMRVWGRLGLFIWTEFGLQRVRNSFFYPSHYFCQSWPLSMFWHIFET